MTNDELEEVEFDQRIVKLMEFLGIKDLNGVQNIKMQRQFDLHSNEWVREQVVLGFTRIVGHADDVVITDEHLSLLPKHYAKEGYYEEKTELDKTEVDDELKVQKTSKEEQ